MSRMFEPGDPISPSGWVVMDSCGRRGRIAWCVARGTCTWCAGPVAPPRRTWCGPECVEKFNQTNPARLRTRVLKRDAGKPCALCGTERFFPEVDHTIPIIEGGHPFDLANLRTICDVCHKGETRALAARRAEARQAEREADDPQAGLFGGDA